MLDPGDDNVAEEVERLLGKHVRRIQLNYYEINSAISFGFGRPRPGQEETEGTIRPDGGKELLMLNPNCKIRFDPDQKPNEILEDMLSDAVMRRATDIHIESYENDVDLRFRIDGIIHQITTPLSVANVKPWLPRFAISHIYHLYRSSHRQCPNQQNFLRRTKPWILEKCLKSTVSMFLVSKF